MKFIPFVSLVSLIAFTGCRSTKTIAKAVVPSMNEPITMIGTSQQSSNMADYGFAAPAQTNTSNGLQENEIASAVQMPTGNGGNVLVGVDNNERIIMPESKQADNIQSFAQVKAMAASGTLKLSNKQMKRLDKLDKKYHGDFKKFENDFGDFSQTAKIIAAVGIIGLLLLLITGSFFGAFLFIVAVGAFLCRWIGVIQF